MKLFNYFSFIQKRNLILGRASSFGTKYYLEQAKIPLIHTLRGSKLNIHPLILNSPLHRETNKEEMNNFYAGAILNERFNCLHVYSRINKNDIWYTTCLNDLIEQGIDREGLVTIAHLGKIETKDELVHVLEDAWNVTEQEYIDIVTLDYNLEWKSSQIDNYAPVVDFLEELCKKEILHSYGFKLDIEPFNQHTPPLGGHFSNVRVPLDLEGEIRENLPNCDLVFYPLSPTIAVPTPTSLLPPETENIDYGKNDENYVEAMQGAVDDSTRRFTRVAVNPFSCYRGHGNDDDDEEEGNISEKHSEVDPDALRASLEAEKHRDFIEGKKEQSGCPQPDDPVLYLIDKLLPSELVELLNNLFDKSVPKLASSKLLQQKVLRVCLSYGHEVCCVQPEILTLLEPFKIKKSDLLTLDEADLIFGGFMIPKEVDEILRDMNGDDAEIGDNNNNFMKSLNSKNDDHHDRYGRTYDVDAESDEELEFLRQNIIKEKKLLEEKGQSPQIPFSPSSFAHPSTMLNPPPPKENKYRKHSSSKRKRNK